MLAVAADGPTGRASQTRPSFLVTYCAAYLRAAIREDVVRASKLRSYPSTGKRLRILERRQSGSVRAAPDRAAGFEGSVELPGELFTYFLSCLASEDASYGCSTEEPLQIRVHDSDGVHFGVSNPADNYSSGARRLATPKLRAGRNPPRYGAGGNCTAPSDPKRLFDATWRSAPPTSRLARSHKPDSTFGTNNSLERLPRGRPPPGTWAGSGQAT